MQQQIFLIVVALLSVGFGMCQVFFQDNLWAFNEVGERLMGNAPTRTSKWDKQTEMMGWLTILVGMSILVLIIMSRIS
jgi:hypothetical protein